MDLSQFDPTSIGSEIGQFVVEMNVKREHDEDLERYSSAAKLYAKQVEPNIMIDITGNDPIVIKTDPDQSNLIANRRVAYENVAHKTDESLKKPMKPLVHRCVGKSPLNMKKLQIVPRHTGLLFCRSNFCAKPPSSRSAQRSTSPTSQGVGTSIGWLWWWNRWSTSMCGWTRCWKH